ncbi:sigma-54-dependent Fis family transcriptional regulator [Endozoicomonas sp. SM1973]|uniref:Sigma-54-dependent Fis family transcriptional regulator n=1 Tax=Spartinivicinus marinus TaxID=2994442 RepID=A0A853IB74_9GAMM|nr:sigma-54 dependent transcriptional regulator [Spartinivicinus marinus]MCX4026350.1 sigma-54 dependent transcriptional regulator [Spartinivicinus marinus]NYZ67304.1 sigma-54-dependent Fis family transcriptional regulator [Spartinivicinus marinus]
MKHILVVEDESVIRAALGRLLERNKYTVSEASSVDDACSQYDLTSDFDLIISDLRLPGAPGTDIINISGNTPVLIMTSYASLRSAVDTMKLGAVDYIAKPFDNDELLDTIKNILTKHSNTSNNQQSPTSSTTTNQSEENEPHNSGIVGKCETMQTLFKRVSKVAPTDSTVLILGESGTGKELVARAIHESSQRADKPMVSVNCAAIPETLIESELFGHEKGAFTGATAARHGLVEAADGGTLFLDEIGELPLEAQARLLRVLQEGEIRRVGSVQSQKVNVRLVAATHRQLKQLAQSGEFREDLYYRLNVIQLNLPPLRERGSDVIDLAKYFLNRICEKLGKESHQFSPDSLYAIQQYSWPGNVRELENAIERSVILADHCLITTDLLGIDLNTSTPNQSTEPQKAEEGKELTLEDYFQSFVLENQERMTETELAQKLGISRKCLWERRQRLGIPRQKATNS